MSLRVLSESCLEESGIGEFVERIYSFLELVDVDLSRVILKVVADTRKIDDRGNVEGFEDG